MIETSDPGDRRGMKVERHYPLALSTGPHHFFLRTHRGGAQFALFDEHQQLVAAGVLDFQETPFPVVVRTMGDETLPFPADEINLWMRTWPPEERLLIDVLSPYEDATRAS